MRLAEYPTALRAWCKPMSCVVGRRTPDPVLRPGIVRVRCEGLVVMRLRPCRAMNILPSLPRQPRKANSHEGTNENATTCFSLTWQEFIKRNGQFTVNVGLCEAGVPILGVVGVPAAEDPRTYFAVKGQGAFVEVMGCFMRPSIHCIFLCVFSMFFVALPTFFGPRYRLLTV